MTHAAEKKTVVKNTFLRKCFPIAQSYGALGCVSVGIINEISVFVIRITFGNMCVGVKPLCLATDVACADIIIYLRSYLRTYY